MRLSKTQVVVMWVLSGLLAALFVGSGGMKLTGAHVNETAQHFGYPTWFFYLIGLIEVVGAVCLLIPRIAAEVGSFLIIIMLGALISHIRAGDGFMGLLPALLALLSLGGVTWLRGEE